MMYIKTSHLMSYILLKKQISTKQITIRATDKRFINTEIRRKVRQRNVYTKSKNYKKHYIGKKVASYIMNLWIWCKGVELIIQTSFIAG